jgi:ABC-2 type transport system ATP-binding protein
MNVLTINNITKHYRSVTALNNVSFSVPEGSVFGILGPNGSGKTTLLGIVTDILRASAGTYRFFDGSQPVNEIRKEMGVLLETPNFYPYLSGWRNLEIAARIKGCNLSRIDETLQRTGLYARRHSKFKTYSLGMKQRLAIASSLLNNPRIVILDEPTNGLDPEGISEIRQLIRDIAAEGNTVILASHLLDEVEKVCTHVAILKRGTLLLAGDVNGALSNSLDADRAVAVTEVSAADIDALTATLANLPGALNLNRTDTGVEINHYDDALTAADINRYCFEHGITLDRLSAKNKNLESKFLELTK